MALFGKKEAEAVDDLVPKKSDFVEKIAQEVIRKDKVDGLVRKHEMEQFYHEKSQSEKIAELKAELAKKDKEIEELKEEIRALRGKAGGVGMGGSPAGR
ncbi:hypothetical protein QIT38_gp10 [Methanocaldococcus fervens tailed virus 1]|uniref:Uncharacterized protein n=2 Tax=root TaxID=1 RepID=C7P5H2_METFA|nr:hypothetical protein [Methanocaldococcus fervens]YP_010772305.1 hypothetical protein QIT38_gp10 [Methanocaldococcus fervens tailed virus 1]ACV25350.1 hypothetical protein Mefer_1547 [Methanocaldococcus fervens AG86]QNO11480.1 hypothetical protein [Methanocaldococcus fervens tailed virus 1]